MLNLLRQLQQQQFISLADYHFAKLIADKQQNLGYSPCQQNLAILLAGLCNFAQQQGHSCLRLDQELANNLFNLNAQPQGLHYLHQIQELIDFLPISSWQAQLQDHIAFSQQPLAKIAPLVFQYGAIYFYRMWQDEYRIAQYLKSAVLFCKVFSEPEMAQIRQSLERYFSKPSQSAHNWQKIATALALRQGFSLISGGPGTGKTYTVAGLLQTLQELRVQQNLPLLRIKLVAPTGKASARLTESINNALISFKKNLHIEPLINGESSTIHRLLGVRIYQDHTQFNAQNPLDIDVLVVDEASMIDLSLMAKLLNALKPETKLILLGDKDQLASVEAGAILGELGQFLQQDYSPAMADYLHASTGESLPTQEQPNFLRDCLCHLTESNRFNADSLIGKLAHLINQGEAKASWALLCQERPQESQNNLYLFQPEAGNNAQYFAQLLQRASKVYQQYLNKIQEHSHKPEFSQQDLESIFQCFNQQRFLTALRVGEFGVENLNQAIADKLRQQGYLQFKHSRDWYHGKPIMVVQNDLNAGLFNGDIGLFLVDASGKGRVWFEESKGKYRAVSASRVPSHESAFVMTVHKSQGSEFEHCHLVLPQEFSPVLTKELLYTAVTRAKQEVSIFSKQEIWEKAIQNPIQRQSGLFAQLLD